ncbi:MAG: TonB-dependent receptor [Steroidobacteraceae bacterium]
MSYKVSSFVLCSLPVLAFGDIRGVAAAEVDAGDGATLEEVVVTAERRTSTIQDTAASISVRDGAEMAQQGRYGLADILKDIPGVTASSSSDGSSAVVIRGVLPSTASGGASMPPTTAQYVDGVYGGLGGNYDIQRVEVLRGPQGTLYGRSATGGVVNTLTRDPELGQFGGDVGVELGSNALRHYSGALNLPLGDTLAVRVSGNRYEREGFISADGGYSLAKDGRFKALYQPNDVFSLLVGVAAEDRQANSGGTTDYIDYNSGVETQTSSDLAVVTTYYKQRQYWANANLDLGFGRLTYIPAYRTATQEGTSTVGGIITETTEQPTNSFMTQELRLASEPDSKVQWQAGVYYYDNKLQSHKTDHWLLSGALVWDQLLNQHTKDLGVFSEVTMPFTDATRLTAGLRYDDYRNQGDQIYTVNTNTTGTVSGSPLTDATFGLPESLNITSIGGADARQQLTNYTYKARLEHNLTAQNLLYGSVSTGFLPGNIALTTGANNVGVALPYSQEKLTAFEIGSKNELLDNRLVVNAGLFYYRYTGYQQAANTGTGAAPNYIIVTSPARMKGGELEVAYQLTRNDRIDGSYGYTNAYFVDKPADFALYVVNDRIVGVAPVRASLGYEHAFGLGAAGELTFRGNARYTGGYYGSAMSAYLWGLGAERYTYVKTYELYDASLTWNSADKKYSATGYVRNIGDYWVKGGIGVSSDGIVGTDGNYGIKGTLTRNEPRTVGVSLAAHF